MHRAAKAMADTMAGCDPFVAKSLIFIVLMTFC